jgi:hypothetical protein
MNNLPGIIILNEENFQTNDNPKLCNKDKEYLQTRTRHETFLARLN